MTKTDRKPRLCKRKHNLKTNKKASGKLGSARCRSQAGPIQRYGSEGVRFFATPRVGQVPL